MRQSTMYENLVAQRELIRDQLQQNRRLIAQNINNNEDVFPRSIAMQLITQQKMSSIIPIIHLSLAAIRFLSRGGNSKAHRLKPWHHLNGF